MHEKASQKFGSNKFISAMQIPEFSGRKISVQG